MTYINKVDTPFQMMYNMIEEDIYTGYTFDLPELRYKTEGHRVLMQQTVPAGIVFQRITKGITEDGGYVLCHNSKAAKDEPKGYLFKRDGLEVTNIPLPEGIRSCKAGGRVINVQTKYLMKLDRWMHNEFRVTRVERLVSNPTLPKVPPTKVWVYEASVLDITKYDPHEKIYKVKDTYKLTPTLPSIQTGWGTEFLYKEV